MATKYDNILNDTIDKHAPIITKTIMIKPYSPWFNSQLSEMKS